jgi:hypothetical protein
MTEAFIQAYFTNLATVSVDIAHTDIDPSFFRVKSKTDLDAFDNAVRNVTKNNVMLLETGAGGMGSWDMPYDTLQIGLHCLVKTIDTNFDNIFVARDVAKAILLKFVARMRIDCQPLGLFSPTAAGPLWNVITNFDSIAKYDDMDGIDGNWYGKAIYFNWKVPLDLSYQTNDWTG